MTTDEQTAIREAENVLATLLRGDVPSSPPSVDPGDDDLRALLATTAQLAGKMTEARDFLQALSQGNLEAEVPARNFLLSPFKELHASLRHLVWQTKQVASGDLNQSVDFLGDFSDAFNTLIASLREKQATEEHLRYLSMHDPLTGLYNRGYFLEEMARLERGRQFPVTVAVGDLDGLKQTNDTFGHEAGDRLICDAAEALRQAVRAGDVIARIGGDEFVAFLPATDEKTGADVLARMRQCLAERRSGSDFPVAMSIGMATAPVADSILDTYRLADRRMYEDKAARKHLAEDFR